MAARGKKEDESEPPEPTEPPGSTEEGEESAGERPRGKRSQESSRSGPLAALSAGLDQIVPGLEILDRELVFEGGARADLAGVDPSGRLHLVLLAGEDPDRAALEVLDALALLRAQLELLVRHFGERAVNPELAPRLLVVSASSDERLSERLAALQDAGVLVLGLRSVKSAAGERSYLVRLGQRPGATSGAGGTAAFLRALPVKLEALGHGLVERMARLDEELEPSADATTLVWRLQGEVLCRVERIGDSLQASVAPRHEPMALADEDDLEKLVERSLSRLVKLLGMTRAEKPAPGAANALPGAREEPLLTPEEIQAFRE